MSFFALLIALLIEQLRPLAAHNAVFAGLRAWSVSVRHALDDGRWPSEGEAQNAPSQAAAAAAPVNAQSLGGAFVWLAAAVVPAAAVGAAHAALAWAGWPLALAFDAAVLYAMLGLRQVNGWTQALRQAWAAGEAEPARQTLADWSQALPIAGEAALAHCGDQDGDVCHAQTLAILGVHQRVLAPMVWFAIGAALGLGAAGAVLYRMGQMLAVTWTGANAPVSAASQAATARAWTLLDWLPARATALGFALVGSFEDAMAALRRTHTSGAAPNAIICAAALAAMGAHWSHHPKNQDPFDRAERLLARAQSHIARIAVVWLVVLAALTLASVPGFQ